MSSKSKTFEEGSDWAYLLDWTVHNKFIETEEAETPAFDFTPPEPYEKLKHKYVITIKKVENSLKGPM